MKKKKEEEEIDVGVEDLKVENKISVETKEEEDVDVDGITEEKIQNEDNGIQVSEKDRALQELIMDSFKYGSSTSGRSTRSSKKYGAAIGPSKPKKRTKRTERTEGDDVDEEGHPKPVKKKKTTGFAKPMVLSPALAGFMDATTLPRTEVVKRLHAYIKDNNLQNPKDKRKIMLDQKLQDIFKCKTTDYFKINRLISKHVKSADEVV